MYIKFQAAFVKEVSLKNFITVICLIKSLIIFRLFFDQLMNVIGIPKNFFYFTYAIAYLSLLLFALNKWPEMRIATVI